MKETWGFAWFATALSAIVLVAMIIGGSEPGLPAYFCFIPIVFFMIARLVKNLTERVSYLEGLVLSRDHDSGNKV